MAFNGNGVSVSTEAYRLAVGAIRALTAAALWRADAQRHNAPNRRLTDLPPLSEFAEF